MSSNNHAETEQIKVPVVRTLKDPPEIWELVHPVEGMPLNPGLSFLELAAKSLIVLVIVGGLGFGVWTAISRFRSVQEPSATKTIRPLPVSRGSETAHSPSSSAPPIESSVTQATDVSVRDNSSRPATRSSKRKRSIAAEVQRPNSASSEATMQVSPPKSPALKTDQQPRVATDSDKQVVADPVSAKPKPTATLNPLGIVPPKSDAKRKAKVIQWP